MKIRRKTAFVFQNYNLFRNKTALQNVTEGLVIARKMPRSQAEKAGKRALDKVGLWDRYDYYPHQLSGGQRQALTLLMATLVPPKLLLLDEHTAALDPSTAEKVLGLTREIVAEHHITTMMVTHNMKNALELGNRTLMMDSGRVVLDIGGEERKGLTVEDLLKRFKAGAGRELDNDRILLSE